MKTLYYRIKCWFLGLPSVWCPKDEFESIYGFKIKDEKEYNLTIKKQ